MLAAVEELDGVGAMFIGSGPLSPSGQRMRFRGTLPHECVPEMLSAADAFVLPTTAEGCCNALLEALACGLPVITSAADFNDDIVDRSVGVLVAPDDVVDIRRAIALLRDEPQLRQKMAKSARDKARKFDLQVRATRIIDWLSKKTAT